MKFILPIIWFLLWLMVICVLFLVIRIVIDFSSPSNLGDHLLFVHFVSGFWRFLATNLPAISWNAATWVPGVGAFVVAVIFLHCWFSRWASRKLRPWSFVTSLCVVSIVPVLFVIAFIVPGILVQWEMLREAKWLVYYN
jgi:hypothetical protein